MGRRGNDKGGNAAPQYRAWWRGKESAHLTHGRDARATIKGFDQEDKGAGV